MDFDEYLHEAQALYGHYRPTDGDRDDAMFLFDLDKEETERLSFATHDIGRRTKRREILDRYTASDHRRYYGLGKFYQEEFRLSGSEQFAAKARDNYQKAYHMAKLQVSPQTTFELMLGECSARNIASESALFLADYHGRHGRNAENNGLSELADTHYVQEDRWFYESCALNVDILFDRCLFYPR